MSKRANALASATDYKGAVRQLEGDHPAMTAKPTGEYDDPAQYGGWRYYIEPPDESWITFVDTSGRALLWTEREENGAVIGEPFEFMRLDLATDIVDAAMAHRAQTLDAALSRRTASAIARIDLPRGPCKAPERVRIWRSGSNPGDYGELFFTPRAARAIMAAYEARGNAPAIDIEHNTNPQANPALDLNNPPVKGGYLTLELVGPPEAPELWMLPRWSDCGAPHAAAGVICCARHQIESGQRCYVSPDWEFDLDTREPFRLNRVGLVSEPGTYGINLLASATAANRRAASMDEIEKLRAAYMGAKNLMESSTDPDIKASAQAMCDKLAEKASALGIALDGAAEPAVGEPMAGSDPAVDPAMASVDTEMAKRAAAEEEQKQVAARAAAQRAQAQRAGAATAARPQALTKADLDAAFAKRDAADRERAEGQALITANRDRIPETQTNFVASLPLAQLRAYVGSLPPRPAASESAAQDGAINGREAAMTPEEKFITNRWASRLGVTPKKAESARAAMSADPDGGVTVDVFNLLDRRNQRAAA